MKRFIPVAAFASVVALVVALPWSQTAVAAAPDGGPARIQVCHTAARAPRDNDGFRLSIPMKALPGHLLHGDCTPPLDGDRPFLCTCNAA